MSGFFPFFPFLFLLFHTHTHTETRTIQPAAQEGKGKEVGASCSSSGGALSAPSWYLCMCDVCVCDGAFDLIMMTTKMKQRRRRVCVHDDLRRGLPPASLHKHKPKKNDAGGGRKQHNGVFLLLSIPCGQGHPAPPTPSSSQGACVALRSHAQRPAQMGICNRAKGPNIYALLQRSRLS
jgi:hypothetical protein